MKHALLDILVCPSCLGDLSPDGTFERDRVVDGSLVCPRCGVLFQVRDGVCVFGMKADTKAESLQEVDGEHRWVCSANDVPAHLEYARSSSEHTEKTLRTILRRLGGRNPKNLRVLDVGCGWGAFQSWRFAREGFNVVATEISPEFLFVADRVVADAYFDRVVADGTVLPFASGSFDVILCKELIHHLPRPEEILRELWRVAAPGAILAIREPCISVLMSKKRQRANDPAVKMGITHYYYSFHEYMRYLHHVTEDVDVEDATFITLNSKRHPILAAVQQLLWRLASSVNKRLTLRAFLLLFGGPVSFAGVRCATYRGADVTAGRDVTPIDMETVSQDVERTTFYRERLIPGVFDIFREGSQKASTV